MMKMNVEGHGEEVLQGAKSLLADGSLEIIVVEWPTRWIYEADRAEHCQAAGVAALKSTGFEEQELMLKLQSESVSRVTGFLCM
jgi:hypothetical protein